MMLGRKVTSRWRLPVWLILGLILTGCAARTEEGDNSTLSLPSVRMALVEIPLNRSDKEVVMDQDPLERFSPAPVAVAHAPSW